MSINNYGYLVFIDDPKYFRNIKCRNDGYNCQNYDGPKHYYLTN